MARFISRIPVADDDDLDALQELADRLFHGLGVSVTPLGVVDAPAGSGPGITALAVMLVDGEEALDMLITNLGLDSSSDIDSEELRAGVFA